MPVARASSAWVRLDAFSFRLTSASAGDAFVVLAGEVGAGAAAAGAAGTVAGGVGAGACRSIIEAWLDRIQARTY